MERTEKVKRLIEETGLSLKAFSEKASIPYTTLRSMLERGVGNASVNNVIKVCKALGIAVEDLEEESEYKPITIAAHHEGEEWTEEELEEIERFKDFVRMKRREQKK